MTTRLSSLLIPAFIVANLALVACNQERGVEVESTIHMVCDASETGFNCEPVTTDSTCDASETGFNCEPTTTGSTCDASETGFNCEPTTTTCDASETGFNCKSVTGALDSDKDLDGVPSSIDCDDWNPRIHQLLYVDQQAAGDIWVCSVKG